MGNSSIEDNPVQQRILEAARQLFTQQGYANTNMREIAERANVNKGLIHYYRWNKRKLFMEVFQETFADFSQQASALFAAESALPVKIEGFVESYTTFLLENPHVPGFVINELNINPESFIQQLMGNLTPPNPMPFLAQFREELEAGKIRPVDPLHFFLHLLSMCVFPFLVRPMFQSIFHISPQYYDKMLANRKKEIVDFALSALYPAEA